MAGLGRSAEHAVENREAVTVGQPIRPVSRRTDRCPTMGIITVDFSRTPCPTGPHGVGGSVISLATTAPAACRRGPRGHDSAVSPTSRLTYSPSASVVSILARHRDLVPDSP